MYLSCVSRKGSDITLTFKKLDIPLGPLILALILGPMAESNFRRALVISQDGGMLIFLTSPIALGLLLIAAVSMAIPIIRKWKAKESL